jgi:hypothetical protein
MVLVQERLAQAAAAYAVQQDIEAAASGGTPRIFTEVNPAVDPSMDAEATEKQLQKLNLLVLSREATAEELADQLELLKGLFEDEGTGAGAWAGLLSVLMRDPEFILY